MPAGCRRRLDGIAAARADGLAIKAQVMPRPVGILMAFAAMHVLGIGSNIMSLGGIAIAEQHLTAREHAADSIEELVLGHAR